MYKLIKKLLKYWYYSEKVLTFASSIFSINKSNLINYYIMAYVIGDDCIACGTCAGECPVEAISEGEKYVIDADACTECGTCASVCPSEAISLG
jgi:ferredoxin